MRAPSYASLALTSLLALLAAGCASAPPAQSGGGETSARFERRRVTPAHDEEPGAEQGPGPADQASEPAAKLAADPYQRTPQGEPAERKPLAPFRAPTTLRLGQRSLRLPASLGVALVREGRCAPAGAALLQLEAALAKERSFREVLGLAPPRGESVGWPELARQARRAGHDLLLVVLAEPRQALLVHTQDARRDPLLLAVMRSAPEAEEVGLDAPRDLGLGLELVIQRLAKAHAGLRLERADPPPSMRE